MENKTTRMLIAGWALANAAFASPALATEDPRKPGFDFKPLEVELVPLLPCPLGGGDGEMPVVVCAVGDPLVVHNCLRSGGTPGRIGTRPVCRVPVAERDLRLLEYRTPQGTVERRWELPKGPNRIPPYIPDMFAEANFKAVAAPIEHGKGQMLDKGPRWPNKGIIKPVSDAPSGSPTNAAGDPCNKPGVQCDPRDSLPPAERNEPPAKPKE